MYHALYGGCSSKHPKGFVLSRPNGSDHYVMLLLKTSGEFLIKGTKMHANAGDAIILSPHDSYEYSNPDGIYMDDWLHFSFIEESLFSDGTLPLNTFFSVNGMEAYSTLIRQILWELSFAEKDMLENNVNCLMHVLFNHFVSTYKSRNDALFQSPFYPKFQQLRLAIRSNPADTIASKTAADQLDISESYFQHLYKDFFGISFQKDLIHMRIGNAESLIRSTDHTFEVIAALCGYSNEVHFYRQFREVTGMTPGEYRQHN